MSQLEAFNNMFSANSLFESIKEETKQESVFEPFQTGEYPVKQVIFVNVDSVLAPLYTSVFFKPAYGRIDIIHQIRVEIDDHVENKLSDVEMLMLTERNVISTCWTIERTLAAIPPYCKLKGWNDDEVRIYCLGWWANGTKFIRP